MKISVTVVIIILLTGVLFIISTGRTNKKQNYQLTKTSMNLTSPAFTEGGPIPQKFTCDGVNINPPLKINGIPEQTKSLALIVTDPDAPMGTFTHWLLWNIDPKTVTIEEGSPRQGTIVGFNDFGKTSYGGPCPPSGTHRYIFTLFALDTILDLSHQRVNRGILETAMTNHVLEQASLIGKYSR